MKCAFYTLMESLMRPTLIPGLLALLTACSPSYQTSSGGDYLAARSFAGEDREDFTALAQVEPHLTFPARIGIARVMFGQLTLSPASEAVIWQGLAQRSQGFGEFVPLSPLISGLIGAETYQFDLEQARAMGARQHLDYILMIDVSGAGGVAQAAFVDVRNGYPYATAEVAVAGAEQRGFWGGNVRNPARRDRMALRLSEALLPEIEAMLTGLAARAEP
jgi:hypothetical protein